MFANVMIASLEPCESADSTILYCDHDLGGLEIVDLTIKINAIEVNDINPKPQRQGV